MIFCLLISLQSIQLDISNDGQTSQKIKIEEDYIELSNLDDDEPYRTNNEPYQNIKSKKGKKLSHLV